MFMRLRKILVALSLACAGNTYALPPQAEADMLMLEIRSDLDGARWQQALPKFARVARLPVKTPETFDYHWAITLGNTGDWPGMLSHLDLYVSRAGSGGKFYKEALGFYTIARKHVETQRRYPTPSNNFFLRISNSCNEPISVAVAIEDDKFINGERVDDPYVKGWSEVGANATEELVIDHPPADTYHVHARTSSVFWGKGKPFAIKVNGETRSLPFSNYDFEKKCQREKNDFYCVHRYRCEG